MFLNGVLLPDCVFFKTEIVFNFSLGLGIINRYSRAWED